MADKKIEQEMRFSDAELEMVKSTFAENRTLLKTMRKAFYQAEMTGAEKGLLTTVFKSNEALLKLVKKFTVPEIDLDAPLGQIIDLWMTIDTKDKDPEMVTFQLISRRKLLDLLNEGISTLQDPEHKPRYILSGMEEVEGKDAVRAYTDLLARNTLFTHIELQLRQILILAGEKEDTVEKTKEKLAKNSSK